MSPPMVGSVTKLTGAHWLPTSCMIWPLVAAVAEMVTPIRDVALAPLHAGGRVGHRAPKVRAGRQYPNEYIETLWGIRKGKSGCNVLLISVIPQTGDAHTCSVTGSDDDFCAYLKATAKATGLTFLGTIHTHNGNEHYEGPSPADNLGAIASGEYFFAIDCIHRAPSGRLRHDVKFWFPQRPIKGTLK